MTTAWHHPSTPHSGRRRGPRGNRIPDSMARTTDSLMDQITNPANVERERLDEPVARPRRWRWKATALGVAVAFGLFLAWLGLAPHRGNHAAAAPTPTPVATLPHPLPPQAHFTAAFL